MVFEAEIKNLENFVIHKFISEVVEKMHDLYPHHRQ
ncbi:hypothetical protein C497_04292 [Halalkalicoccus jeotgali B3]|uniref:Uncharacterized protein n=1 Tax=Halalkalicoccus jeotgali (strain DSM 18796 / CECT 7217 / JCM 14584 / KCTC 4019 / B3) TaxID=795797 RepID=D8JA53_HALJB|nr:hypothetical protein HacjB3_05920 [Halalkalicoccus jeotgali B3]ELY39947.1 hypothetical protein C497_04292 [Halalkalicoccus jeotgali B3]